MTTSTITVKHGTEGPCHDPYSYEEVTLHLQNGAYATIHEGLREDLRVKFRRGHKERTLGLYSKEERVKADLVLQRAVGMTVQQIKRAARKLHEAVYRVHKAHGGIEWSAGFPGEHLCFCKCGMVIDSTFNEAAIR